MNYGGVRKNPETVTPAIGLNTASHLGIDKASIIGHSAGGMLATRYALCTPLKPPGSGLNAGPGRQVVAWNSALIYDMIFTHPVVYEFPKLQMPTLLMIGQTDTTAIGSDITSAEVKAKIGHYPRVRVCTKCIRAKARQGENGR